jgi:hypothetical protein
MSLNLAAFLLGLFIVPIVLLAMGHKLRRRSTRVQKAFWGGVFGYCVAGTAAVIYGMIPPENWVEGETARGFIGFWGMLVLPILGSVVAVTTARSDPD